MKIFLLLFLFLLTSRSTFASDIYGLIDSSCNVHTGFIIGADEKKVDLLTLDGKSAVVSRPAINTIVIFTTLENPIPEIKMDEILASRAKNIYVHEEGSPAFTGWPVRFVEELVIFYDIAGKTHVLDLSDVTRIRDVKNSGGSVYKNPALQKIQLNYTDVNSRCSTIPKPSREGIGPTRIIDDKINVSEFLSNFEKGFQNIESYEERTYFYAKPYLYEKRSKLGLILFNRYEENPSILPVYFQWATGKPYGFQTFDVFGSAPVEWLPISEPAFVFRSDVKSHFFNASFVGNIVALPAGSAYYSNLSSNVPLPQNVMAAHQFNYLTLLGADYGPFSASVGTFFPIFDFQVKNATSNENREVLANALAPAFRAMYVKGPLTLRAIYSATQESGSGTSTNNLRVTTGQPAAPDNYNLTGSFLRVGVDYIFTDVFKAGLDEILVIANYTENYGAKQYFFNSQHLATSAYLAQNFGYYISVKGFINLFSDQYSYTFVNGTDSPSSITTSIGAAFEFDF